MDGVGWEEVAWVAGQGPRSSGLPTASLTPWVAFGESFSSLGFSFPLWPFTL